MKTPITKQDIKVVVLCGGGYSKEFADKPKQLYHIDGKQPLISIFNSLSAVGIESNKVRLLLGYYAEYTKKSLAEQGLYPEIMVNKHYDKSAICSSKIAFDGLSKQSGDILVMLGDEFHQPDVIKQIILAKGDLVCFNSPQIKNRLSPPIVSIFKFSARLIDYFRDDIYLNSDFFLIDKKSFKIYFDYESTSIPNELPCKINTGYALGYMRLHTFDRLRLKFPQSCVFLPDHGLYVPDLDSITQTDEFKQKMLLIRSWISMKKNLKLQLINLIKKSPVLYKLLKNIRKTLSN